MRKLTAREARLLILDRQGLLEPSSHYFKSAEEALKHLGYVQIDTISVIERAHDHVLWSRYPGARRNTLNELVKEKKAFECWSHAAAFLPIENFRYSLIRKSIKRKQYQDWLSENKKIVRKVRDTIKREGAKKSSDFESDGTKGGWWNWKPAKEALEVLWRMGDLMVSHREGFQKVYDLTERVLPSQIETKTPTLEEHARHLISESIRTQCIFRPGEVAYLRHAEVKKAVKLEMERMKKSGELVFYSVEGVEKPFYGAPDLEIPKTPKHERTHFLNPFDHLVIQRKRLSEFFNFDYQIECYVPEPKRKYGYYTVPVLQGLEFIARADFKADREEKTLRVKKWWSEDGKKPDIKKRIIASDELRLFTEFNACKKLSGF